MPPLAALPAVPRGDRRAIDQALRLVDADHRRWAARLSPDGAPCPALTPGQLRQSQLGQDLQRLALVARGRLREPQERVLAAVESVLQLLFCPAGAADYAVPRAFWATDLGGLLARATDRAFAADELLGIGEAAQRLGVTRSTIARWIADGTLDSARDERSGRTFVVRGDVARRQLPAAVRPAAG